MILSSHGVIASQIASFDADALAFINAAGITDATQKNAINTLVLDLKGYSIWTKMKAIYPMVGGTSTTHKYNLKDPRDLDAAFRLVFSGGWTHSSTGATPNGTNGYADTYLTPSSSLSQNSTHISIYHTQSTAGGISIGSSNNSYAQGIYISPRYPSLNNAYIRVNDSTGVSASNSDASGFWIASRTASNVIKVFKQNTTFISGTTTSSGLSTRSIYLGAGNLQTTEYSPLTITIASIGDGLTDTEASNLYTSVQAFQTTLGRQV